MSVDKSCEDKNYYYMNLERRLSYSKCYNENDVSFEEYKNEND